MTPPYEDRDRPGFERKALTPADLGSEYQNTGKQLAPPPLRVEARPVQRQPSGSPALAMRRQMGGKQAIQRASVDTNYGTFKDAIYKPIKRGGRSIGVQMHLEFHPGSQVNAEKIAMTQAIHTYNEGQATAWHPTGKGQIAANGYRIDQDDHSRSPLYAVDHADDADTDLGTANTNAAFGHHGKHVPGATDNKEALLIDNPQSYYGKNSGQHFETTALAVDGAQDGMYYGSVRWGYEIDSAGKFRQLPMTLLSESTPTEAFNQAAAAWNPSHARGTVEADQEPTPVYNKAFKQAFTVPRGTNIIVFSDANSTFGDELYMDVMIQEGTHSGKTGWMKLNHLRDTGDGSDTLDLPIVAPLYQGPHDDILGIPPAVQLPKTTKVKVLDDSDNITAYVQVVDGPRRGLKGYTNTLGGLPFQST
ncbi:MAG: hypothetical protein D6722_20125 [Bacteroidetes bacterium]|nr:MAG: hypothetical protein D6722_20125 [Bacteroidota bacterium]